jgi:N-acetyl-beta-hexosaminidase
MLLLTHTWMSPRAADFHNAIIVKLGTKLEGAELRYTLDGVEPTAQSPLYAAPVSLKQTTVVKAATFRGDQKSGRTLEREYVKLPSSTTAMAR